MTPYYQSVHVTLYHADNRDVLPHLPEAVVVTDPPYGQTSLTWDRWQSEWLTLVKGNTLWCCGSLRMFMQRAGDFAAGGWKLSQDVIWEKHNGSGFHNDRFRRVHEQVAHFYRGAWGDVWRQVPVTLDARPKVVRRKERPPHCGAIENSTYVSVDGGPRLQRSVLRVRGMHGTAIHPTEKPVGLLLPLLEYAAWPGALVCDPFAGSGAVVEAALQRGHPVVAIEASEAYCEGIAQRLRQLETAVV